MLYRHRILVGQLLENDLHNPRVYGDIVSAQDIDWVIIGELFT